MNGTQKFIENSRNFFLSGKRKSIKERKELLIKLKKAIKLKEK